MVIHNPNNWHWVNKDASAWARDYLDQNLAGISAEEGGVSAKVDKVLSMDGDVDVNQRKGKVITLYDVKVQLEYSGKTKDDEDVSGTITIPEVAHDTEEDEYVVCSLAFLIIVSPASITDSSPHVKFDIDIYSESTSKQPVKDLVRSKIVPHLRKQLITLGPALIKEHGKDLQHAPDSSPSSGLATPTHNNPTSSTTAAPATAKASSAPTTTTTTSQSSSAASLVNTTTVTSTEEFRTTAAELYQTFTDPARLAAFTRAPPKLFEGAHVGGKFELFGGNVMGEYAELEAPTKLVQKWRLKQWPAGHYSRLEIRFDQNDVDAVTVMRVVWDGVPVGQEEVTRRNWGEYYVRSIKTTFGFGTIL